MSDNENERVESPAESAAAASSPARAADADDSGKGSDTGGLNGDNAASGDDLFGDGNDDESELSDQPLSEHGLSDDDQGMIDDDDDEGQHRYGSDDEGRRRREPAMKEEIVLDVNIFRHRVPKPTDGTLKSLRVPPFIKFNPKEYSADNYEPSAAELEASLGKNAPSVVRFRHDPAGSGALQSNSMLYRWSDGSVTLAVGDEHFEVLTKSLAPAAATATGNAAGEKYQELQDAHYYAAAAHLSSSLLMTVGHVTDQYSVRANRAFADDALDRLANRLNAATQSSATAGANMIIRTVRDPELAKKEAEAADKERERARRRKEAAIARMDGGGRSGGWGGGGALSIGDLEGGLSSSRRGAGAGGRKRSVPSASRGKRRRPEYDSDDELPQGARRSDDYDKADDFIAPSDEDLSDEVEEEEGDEDEEDEVAEDEEDEEDGGASRSRRAKRQKTAETEDNSNEEDAPAARRNRRHIIDDDDE